MTAPRFFITQTIPEGPWTSVGRMDVTRNEEQSIAVPLSEADLHHATTVARIRPGEEITVVDGERAVWRLQVTKVSREALSARVVGRSESQGGPHITLVQGVAKGSKMDRVVEQSVEIGVERIIPLLAERSVVRLDAAKATDRADRWRRIAGAAAKQSRAAWIPRVDDPAELESLLGVLTEYDVVLVPWEDAGIEQDVRTALVRAGARVDSRVAVVVGPEGGLSATEVLTLAEAGGVTCSLGSTILRTETAAIVALALVTDALRALDDAR